MIMYGEDNYPREKSKGTNPQLTIVRSFFKIRSHSQIPGCRFIILGAMIQAATLQKPCMGGMSLLF